MLSVINGNKFHCGVTRNYVICADTVKQCGRVGALAGYFAMSLFIK